MNGSARRCKSSNEISGPEDLWKEQTQLGFSGSIAVQARQSLEETRDLLDMAERDERIKGVVGWVDLRADDLEKQLVALASHPKLVGMRHCATRGRSGLYASVIFPERHWHACGF